VLQLKEHFEQDPFVAIKYDAKQVMQVVDEEQSTQLGNATEQTEQFLFVEL
jgi:hypothetical protein